MSKSKTTKTTWVTTTRVGENGQVTIPSTIRERLELGAGKPVSIFLSGPYVVLVPEQERLAEDAEVISSALPLDGFVRPVVTTFGAPIAEAPLTTNQQQRVRAAYEYFKKDIVSREDLLRFGDKRFGTRNALMFLRKKPELRRGWGLYRLPIEQLTTKP